MDHSLFVTHLLVVQQCTWPSRCLGRRVVILAHVSCADFGVGGGDGTVCADEFTGRLCRSCAADYVPCMGI